MAPAGRSALLLPCAGALLVALLGLTFAPMDDVLREDALIYLDQSFAVRAGDWTASEHPVGWPLLLAGVLSALGLDARVPAMPVARLLSVLCLAACAFPIASLARRAAGERAALLAVLGLVASPTLVWLGGIAYADPLFLLLVTSAAALAARSEGRLAPLLAAFAVASLSWWVKASGMYVGLALLAWAAFTRRRAGLGLVPLLLPLLVFVAVSVPHLALRAQTYGSPFHYGENSKYFVESIAQVWDKSVPVPTLGEYLATHTPAQWFHKFVVRGAVRVAWNFAQVVGLLWFPLLLCGTWLFVRRPRATAPELSVPLTLLAMFLLGLIPVFDVFSVPRYLAMTLPLAFVVGAAGFARLVEGRPRARLLTGLFAALLVAQLPVAYARGQLRQPTAPFALDPPRVRDAWAAWTVRHVPPPVAILEGGDLLQLAFDDALAAGEVPAAWAARDDYPTRRPGPRPDAGVALDELLRLGIGHVLVDSRNSARMPWLQQLDDPRWAGRVERVRSFEAPPDERWALRDMDVLRIVRAP
jgi:hypothetical protein